VATRDRIRALEPGWGWWTRPRLFLAIYTMMLRVGSCLGAQVEDLGYDKGYRTPNVRPKSGRREGDSAGDQPCHRVPSQRPYDGSLFAP
jgi:hypothetical protein